MPRESRDPAYLWDMLEAAKTIMGFTQDVTPEQYRADLKLRLAVEREIGIIGEAARRVSGPFQSAHPEIPWQKIIAQRNVMIHEYGDVDHERIWQVVIDHIPRLIEQLTPLIPAIPEEPKE